MPERLCPYCDTPLRVEFRPYSLHGVYLGRFEMLVCPIEHRVFHSEETSKAIEVAASQRGLFVPQRSATNDVPAVTIIAVSESPPGELRIAAPQKGNRVSAAPAATKRPFDLRQVVVAAPAGN